MGLVKGFFTTFFESFVVWGATPWDLNPFPLWLAEVYLSLPLTLIIILSFAEKSIGFLKVIFLTIG